MGSQEQKPTDFDVIIVGAGISGINAAYRLQKQLPKLSYTILEARGALGGTWDFFQYPGIRSDSDLYTFGFDWNPWKDESAIAAGGLIRDYMVESAAMFGIDKKIQYHHKLVTGNWSTEQQQWTLNILGNGKPKTMTTRFLIMGTGYYDYNEGLKAVIPGLEKFKGTVVHPQFWPEDLDYNGKKIIIVGSGATAVTLLPVLAEKANGVTMLQRSPSYIVPQTRIDPVRTKIRKWLPWWLAFKVIKWRILIRGYLVYNKFMKDPETARKSIRALTEKMLGPDYPIDTHFNPSYNPWQQRLCVCPDGDMFKSLRKGTSDIVTDVIETVTEDGILTKGGQDLKADMIITATGLKVILAGGVRLSVDGEYIELNQKFFWRATMIQDLPNVTFMMGYNNASYTLGADVGAVTTCKLLQYMSSHKIAEAVPRVDTSKVSGSPWFKMSSTYLQRGQDVFPKAGDGFPWWRRPHYFFDYFIASWWGVTKGLEFTKIKSFDKSK